MADKINETKGSFKLIGKVTRIDKDNAYKEERMDKPNTKNHDRLYRSLRFGIKTSEGNEITVGSFDYEPEEVFLWNSKKREEDESYKGEKIPFGTWEQREEELREQGYAVLQSRVGLTYGEDGKLETKGLPRYVASLEIYENLNNGDSVVVEGTIRYTKFKNRNDQIVEQKNYTIEKLFKIKDVDFEAEDFEEVSYFEQQMIYVDADIDKTEGKAYVTGRIVDYSGNFEDTQFIVDFTDGEGGYDKDMVKLADSFKKRIKFGDVVDVYGDTINRVVIEEKEEDDNEEDDLIASLGGKSKPKHAQNYSSRSYITEMRINGINALDQGVYTEDDFIKDELLEEDEKDLTSEFGGKKKSDKGNPFDLDDEDLGSISDEDLPF